MVNSELHRCRQRHEFIRMSLFHDLICAYSYNLKECSALLKMHKMGRLHVCHFRNEFES